MVAHVPAVQGKIALSVQNLDITVEMIIVMLAPRCRC